VGLKEIEEFALTNIVSYGMTVFGKTGTGPRRNGMSKVRPRLRQIQIRRLRGAGV
jgi:hypothetical protein